MECKKCGSKWETDASRSVSMTVCPFCQKKLIDEMPKKFYDNTKELLVFIATVHGIDALFNKGVFPDFIDKKSMPKGQQNLIKQAFDCGVVKMLQDNIDVDSARQEDIIKGAVMRMVDEYASSEEAVERLIREFIEAIDLCRTKPQATAPQSADPQTKECKSCGANLPDSAKFCNRCGTKAEDSDASAATIKVSDDMDDWDTYGDDDSIILDDDTDIEEDDLDVAGMFADINFEEEDVSYNDTYGPSPHEGLVKIENNVLIIAEGVTEITRELVLYASEHSNEDFYTVEIPLSAKEIGEGAFAGQVQLCRIETKNVSRIGALAFYGCISLMDVFTSVGIDNISIEKNAFYKCSDRLFIFDELSEDTISQLDALLEYRAETDAEQDTIDDLLNSSFPLSTDDPSSLIDAFNSDINYIYDKEHGHSVCFICSHQKPITKNDFLDYDDVSDCYYNSLDRIIGLHIIEGTSEIADEAFAGENIIFVIIPDSVTSIGNGAFRDCKKLKYVYMPYSLSYMGDSVFKGCCTLEEITIPEGIDEIGDEAFLGCTSLETIVLPKSGVTRIGSKAFKDCISLLGTAKVSADTIIENDAFAGCDYAPQKPPAAKKPSAKPAGKKGTASRGDPVTITIDGTEHECADATDAYIFIVTEILNKHHTRVNDCVEKFDRFLSTDPASSTSRDFVNGTRATELDGIYYISNNNKQPVYIGRKSGTPEKRSKLKSLLKFLGEEGSVEWTDKSGSFTL